MKHYMMSAGYSACGISDPPYEEGTMNLEEVDCEVCRVEEAKWIPMTEEESKRYFPHLWFPKPK